MKENRDITEEGEEKKRITKEERRVESILEIASEPAV